MLGNGRGPGRDDADDRRLRRVRRARRARCPGAPPITALVGDQQASLVGQGCVRRGDAKITFGTGGMLDVVLDETPPRLAQRSEHGTFPIVAWRHDGRMHLGRRSRDARGRHERAVAARRPRDHRELRRVAHARRVVRRQRRRRVRARAARARHAGLGLRRARRALRADARHRPRRDRARGARRHRAPRRRPRRRGRRRQRDHDSRTCASTAA